LEKASGPVIQDIGCGDREMLVDRDKAIEACAKVAESIWDNVREGAHGGEQANRTAAAIRQLTLEDCRVESTPHKKAVVDFLEQEANDLLAGKHKKGYRFREIADLIESLSAEVAELRKDAERY